MAGEGHGRRRVAAGAGLERRLLGGSPASAITRWVRKRCSATAITDGEPSAARRLRVLANSDSSKSFLDELLGAGGARHGPQGRVPLPPERTMGIIGRFYAITLPPPAAAARRRRGSVPSSLAGEAVGPDGGAPLAHPGEQALVARLPLAERHVERLLDGAVALAGRCVGVDMQRLAQLLGGARELAEHAARRVVGRCEATNSLATRFMPSRSGVTSIDVGARGRGGQRSRETCGAGSGSAPSRASPSAPLMPADDLLDARGGSSA